MNNSTDFECEQLAYVLSRGLVAASNIQLNVEKSGESSEALYSACSSSCLRVLDFTTMLFHREH